MLKLSALFAPRADIHLPIVILMQCKYTQVKRLHLTVFIVGLAYTARTINDKKRLNRRRIFNIHNHANHIKTRGSRTLVFLVKNFYDNASVNNLHSHNAIITVTDNYHTIINVIRLLLLDFAIRSSTWILTCF